MRIIKRLSYLALIASCLTLQANINNLKGTFDILKDEYKQFSIINGAIADQTGYIMHLYDYGTLGQMRKESAQSAVLVPDISNAPEVIKLVHLFFHRTPGTIGRGDFVLTQDLQAASAEEKQNIIKAIAWMMAQVKQLEDEIAKSPKIKPSISQQIKAIRLKDLTIKSELPHFAYLANLAGSSSVIDILKENPDALKVFKLIWQSMQQEHGSIAKPAPDAKTFFPRFTTNTVLLGIIYKLADNNKRLIQVFYEKLNEIIISAAKDPTSSIFINDQTLDQSRLDERFNPSDKQMLGEQLTFSADNLEQLKQHYESIVYLALLPGALPQEAGYIKAHYHYDPSDPTKAVKFPDCMETTLRNIMNFLLYVQDNLTFSFTKIPNANPVQQLKDFYQKNSSAADTESKHLHDQWAQVIENIPFVAYKHKVGESQDARALGKIGYIKVPGGISLGNDYIPVGPDDIIYEIRATLKNFIIIFNHLLQLNLFDNEVGNTPDEKTAAAFVRPDFIKTYFPQLCEKLNITFNGFFEDSTNIIDTVDSKDYGPEITTKLSLGSTNVNLVTKRGHGYIKIKGGKVAEKDPLLAWLYSNFQIIIDSAGKFFDNYFFSFPYLAAYKQRDHINVIISEINPTHCFNLLYYLPLGNVDYVKDLIWELSRSKTQFNEYTVRLLFYLARTMPDENQKSQATIKMDAIIVENSKWAPTSGLTGIKNSTAQDLIHAASEAIKSTSDDIQISGIILFRALLEKKQGYPEAIHAALQAIKSTTLVSRFAGYKLFSELINKGQGYLEATQAAVEASKSEKADARIHGIILLEKLVKKGQGYQEAIQVLIDSIKSGATSKILDLFKKLQAAKIDLLDPIAKAINSEKDRKRQRNLELFLMNEYY